MKAFQRLNPSQPNRPRILKALLGGRGLRYRPAQGAQDGTLSHLKSCEGLSKADSTKPTEKVFPHTRPRSVLLLICLLSRYTVKGTRKAHIPAAVPQVPRTRDITGFRHPENNILRAPGVPLTKIGGRNSALSDFRCSQINSNQRAVISGALKSTLKSTQINAK